MSYDASELVSEAEAGCCPVIELTAFGPDVAADPHPFYSEIRNRCPVGSIGFDPDAPAYVLSRYEDVQFALRNPEIFGSEDAVDIGQERPLIPLQIDPPDHVQWRRLMDPYLAPKQVAALEDDFRSLTNAIIDEFDDTDRINFHQAFSVPLPSIMFLRLLGLPIDELGMLVRWKDNIIRPDAAGPEDAQRIRHETGREMYEYFESEIVARRDEPREDLLSEFVHGDIGGRNPTQNEILDIMYLFLLGGLDTVTATLDCTVAHLAADSERRRLVMEHAEMIPAVVEEMLRFHTPVMGIIRTVRQPVELHGVELEPGATVMVMIGSANTDEAVFERAGEVDFDRQANKHYAFGGGPHRCLGSHLARLELRVGLEEFHRRVSDYSIPDGVALEFSPGIREVADFPLLISRSG